MNSFLTGSTFTLPVHIFCSLQLKTVIEYNINNSIQTKPFFYSNCCNKHSVWASFLGHKTQQSESIDITQAKEFHVTGVYIWDYISLANNKKSDILITCKLVVYKARDIVSFCLNAVQYCKGGINELMYELCRLEGENAVCRMCMLVLSLLRNSNLSRPDEQIYWYSKDKAFSGSWVNSFLYAIDFT